MIEHTFTPALGRLTWWHPFYLYLGHKFNNQPAAFSILKRSVFSDWCVCGGGVLGQLLSHTKDATTSGRHRRLVSGVTRQHATYLLSRKEVHVEELPFTVNQRQKCDGDIIISVQISTSTSVAIPIILHGNQSREVAPCISQSNWTFPTKTLFPQQRQINS